MYLFHKPHNVCVYLDTQAAYDCILYWQTGKMILNMFLQGIAEQYYQGNSNINQSKKINQPKDFL